MKLSIIFILNFLLAIKGFSQDERNFRKIITGELTKQDYQEVKEKYKLLVRSPYYLFDLDEDSNSESFVVSKKDGEDWFSIYDSNKKEIFKYRLETKGNNSSIYRITGKMLSKSTKVFIIHFFEGYTDFLEFTGTARFYFLTLDNNDLKTLSIYKGPYFWYENKGFKDSYQRRQNFLNFKDYDNDGIKEIITHYRSIKRIFKYKKFGKWVKL